MNYVPELNLLELTIANINNSVDITRPRYCLMDELVYNPHEHCKKCALKCWDMRCLRRYITCLK